MPEYLSGMRPGYRIFSSLFFAMVFVILQGCDKASMDDRALIQQRLQQMARAVEQRQVAGFLEGVDKDFLGQGSLRKANLAGLLLLQFRQHPAITVRLTAVEIQLGEASRATASFEAHVSGQGGWLGQGRELHIQSRWHKHAGEWRVERARWRQSP